MKSVTSNNHKISPDFSRMFDEHLVSLALEEFRRCLGVKDASLFPDSLKKGLIESSQSPIDEFLMKMLLPCQTYLLLPLRR